MSDFTARRLTVTTQIMANYVATCKVAPDRVADLIQAVHLSLSSVEVDDTLPSQGEAIATRAEIKRSISEAGLVSFLDGRTYQSLKRHLTQQGMTPDDYRARFGLDDSYPMVSPAYSARRSKIAKTLGFGLAANKSGTPARLKPRGRKAKQAV